MQTSRLVWQRLVVVLFLLTSHVGAIKAQIRAGLPTAPPDGSAALDISGGPYPSGSEYRGIAPPKVALTKISVSTPVTKPVVGLLVYNTSTTEDLTPGYYYWEGSHWLRFNTASNTNAGGARVAAVNGQSIPAYLINQVSGLTTDIIYIADEGREGMFRYVSGSTATVDGAMILTAGSGRYKRIVDSSVSVRWFGAKGDGTTDDTQALAAAFRSGSKLIIIPPTNSYYKTTDLINTITVTGLHITASGAKILNSELSKASFLFQNCQDLSIEGGEWGYVNNPTTNGGNSQHVFQFDQSQRVLVNKVHIRNSPEMGIAITNSDQITVQNSKIEHTWRDGTYAHYSANVKYLNNVYSNIKDDAMSFHDYGRSSERSFITALGYAQATNLLAQGNTVENVYQGFSSIAGDGVQVLDNRFKNTVLAGVAIWNSNELYANGTALAKNSRVSRNTFENVCSTTTINGTSYANSGQSGPGRAAIFVGSTGTNNQVGQGESKHLSNIQVANNTVISSSANAFWANLVDGLELSNNVFMNSAGANPSQQLGGIPVEISSVTGLQATNNTVVDTRSQPLHQYGYQFANVTGYSETWNIVRRIVGDVNMISGVLTSDALNRRIPQPLGFLESNGVTDWNSLKLAGSYQVAGTGWSDAAITHSPKDFGVANAGTLTIDMSGDTETQTYTDYLGNRVWRHLNGLSSTAWSEWTSVITQTTIDSKRIPQSRSSLYSDQATDWNTLKLAGSYQVSGTGWNPTTTHSPKDYGVANAGTLTIEISGDTETQTYTDYLGNRTWRHLNGLSSNDWSPWASMAIKQTDFKVGSAQQSANGSAISFAISHGLGVQPSYISIEAATPDADKSNIKYITADATSIVINYKTPPPAGSGNLVWYWSARK